MEAFQLYLRLSKRDEEEYIRKVKDGDPGGREGMRKKKKETGGKKKRDIPSG